MNMINATDKNCGECRYGTIIEESKASIKFYCSIKEKTYIYGQCIPCDLKEKRDDENGE